MAIPFPNQVSTLGKYGISHTGDSGSGPILMPKVQHRWRVLFIGFGNTTDHGRALTLNANSVTIPTLTFESQTVHSYNSRVYFAGKHEWGTSSLVIRDTIDQTVEKAVGAQMQKQLDHYSQTGWRAASDYKFTCMIQSLNGDHASVLDSWTLEGCWLINSNHSELSYEQSGARTITMEIRPDNCILEEFAGGTNSMWDDPSQNPKGAHPLGVHTGT